MNRHPEQDPPRRKQKGEIPLKLCRACFHLMPIAAKKCDACGVTFIKRAK